MAPKSSHSGPSGNYDILVPVVWNPLYSTLSAVAASIAVTLYLLQHGELVVTRSHEAVQREPQRVFAAFIELYVHVADKYKDFYFILNTLGLVFGGAVALKVYFTVHRILRDALVRRKQRSTEDCKHATTFSHEQNAQLNTKFSSLSELLLLTSVSYLFDASNLVVLLIVILQAIGSNFTKHKLNMWMYFSFYAWTLVTELQTYFSKRSADNTVNSERYWCSLLGNHNTITAENADLQYDKLGLVQVPAKSIGLGNLVIVMPGQRTPIDGFALKQPFIATSLPQQHAPFNYAVTGENTIMNPAVVMLPISFSDVSTMEYCREHFATVSQTPIKSSQPREGDLLTSPRPRSASDSIPPVKTTVQRSSSDGSAGSPPPSTTTSAATTPGELKKWVEGFVPRVQNVIANPGASRKIHPEKHAQYVYLINNKPVPSDVRIIPRGSVHAPPDQRTPLFLLAGTPNRLLPHGTAACEPEESRWRWIVKRVITIQLFVLLFFSIQGWAAAQHMSAEKITVGSFVSFLLGQMVLGNTLIPLRESVMNAFFLGICQALFPGVTVREYDALETLRVVENVVSDKTGTLTVDSMSLKRPVRNPDFDDAHDIWDLLLLANNDSEPNPYAATSDPSIDARLRQSSSLCTTPEEGAIFESLVQRGRLRWLGRQGRSPMCAIYVNEATNVLYRVVWHFCGGFEPIYVARFSVVSIHTKPLQSDVKPQRKPTGNESEQDNETVVGPEEQAACTAFSVLQEKGWQLLPGSPFLVIQGGGDTVAHYCGDRVRAWEQAELEKDPSRTLGHAMHAIGNIASFLQEDCPKVVEDAQVYAIHKKLVQGLTTPEAPRYQMIALSKFDNPVVPEGHRLMEDLAVQGLRLHVCTGDTSLTLQAVMKDLGVLRNTDCSICWDEKANADALKAMQEVLDPNTAVLPEATRDPIYHALSMAKQHGRVLLLCNTTFLKVLSDHRDHPAVQALIATNNVYFGFYRVKQVDKPLAVQLLSAKDASRCIFMGDGPNDATALAATPHSFAMDVGALSAKNAANFSLSSSVALPDAITLSRLLHGGRAIVLRDIVFVGSFIVVLLAVAAHLTNFRTIGRKIKVLEDPWNPLFMSLFTMLIHTPRTIVLAVTEGLHVEWADHRDLVVKTMIEAVFGSVCSLWIGIILKDTVQNRLGEVDYATTSAMYAPLALASLAVVTYLRQNLVISRKLWTPPRLLPPVSKDVGVYLYRGPGTQRVPSVKPSKTREIMAYVLWFFNGIFGQIILLLIYVKAISNDQVPVLDCLLYVGKATFGPLLVMLLFRLAVILTRETTELTTSESSTVHSAKLAAMQLRYGVPI